MTDIAVQAAEPGWRAVESARSLRSTLAAQRTGGGLDPTTRVRAGEFVQATLTPDGPGTVLLRWVHDPAPVAGCGLTVDAWGPGGPWLAERAEALTGAHDTAVEWPGAHPVVTRSLAATRTMRIGANGNLYHHLLPTVIAQRITSGEAVRQWAALCRRLGEAPPGPAAVVEGMRLPPAPNLMQGRPAWWFHPLGIEAKRARALVEVARHADRSWEWAQLTPAEAGRRLQLLPGVGVWTAGCVLGPALGDADAVPVGDFHIPHAIAWALAGEARATDDRMLELLEPYRGQRGRVVQAILRCEGTAPKFGPRRRVMNIRAL